MRTWFKSIKNAEPDLNQFKKDLMWLEWIRNDFKMNQDWMDTTHNHNNPQASKDAGVHAWH